MGVVSDDVLGDVSKSSSWQNMRDAAGWLEAGHAVLMRQRDTTGALWIPVKCNTTALLLDWEYRLAPEPDVVWVNKQANGERAVFNSEAGAVDAADRIRLREPYTGAFEYVARRYVEQK